MPPRELEELLSAYLDHEATPEERATVEHHLQQSPSARDALNDFSELGDLLRGLPNPTTSPDFSARILAALPPLAAATAPANSNTSANPNTSGTKSAHPQGLASLQDTAVSSSDITTTTPVVTPASPRAAETSGSRPDAPSARRSLWKWSIASTTVAACLGWGLFLLNDRPFEMNEKMAGTAQVDSAEAQDGSNLAAGATMMAPMAAEAAPDVVMATEIASDSQAGTLAAKAAAPAGIEMLMMSAGPTASESESLTDLVNRVQTPLQPGDVLRTLQHNAASTQVVQYTVIDTRQMAGTLNTILLRNGLTVITTETSDQPASPDTSNATASPFVVFVEAEQQRLNQTLLDLEAQPEVVAIDNYGMLDQGQPAPENAGALGGAGSSIAATQDRNGETLRNHNLLPMRNIPTHNTPPTTFGANNFDIARAQETNGAGQRSPQILTTQELNAPASVQMVHASHGVSAQLVAPQALPVLESYLGRYSPLSNTFESRAQHTLRRDGKLQQARRTGGNSNGMNLAARGAPRSAPVPGASEPSTLSVQSVPGQPAPPVAPKAITPMAEPDQAGTFSATVVEPAAPKAAANVEQFNFASAPRSRAVLLLQSLPNQSNATDQPAAPMAAPAQPAAPMAAQAPTTAPMAADDVRASKANSQTGDAELPPPPPTASPLEQ